MQLNIQMFGGRGARSNRQVKKTDEQNKPLFEHEKEKSKYDKRTRVNMKVISSKGYANKFKINDLRLSDCMIIANRSREILKTRNKSEYEDIFAYNIDTGEIINGEAPIKKHEAISGKKLDDLDKNNANYVVVHNHPLNVMPSTEDLSILLDKRKNSKCCYVICHNGDVWKYSIDKSVNKTVDIGSNVIYNEDDLRQCYKKAVENGTDVEIELAKNIGEKYGLIIERI